MLTFSAIAAQLRAVEAIPVADRLEMAVKTEQAKVSKGEKQGVGLMVERILRTQIEESLKGRAVIVPGRFMHLESIVRDVVEVLKKDKTSLTKRPKPETKPEPRQEAEPKQELEGGEKRGAVRTPMEEVLDGLDMAVRMDGFSILVGQDRGRCVVTLMATTNARMITVVGDTMKEAFTDAVGKLMRLLS